MVHAWALVMRVSKLEFNLMRVYVTISEVYDIAETEDV